MDLEGCGSYDGAVRWMVLEEGVETRRLNDMEDKVDTLQRLTTAV